jgi:hypothetical protein
MIDTKVTNLSDYLRVQRIKLGKRHDIDFPVGTKKWIGGTIFEPFSTNPKPLFWQDDPENWDDSKNSHSLDAKKIVLRRLRQKKSSLLKKKHSLKIALIKNSVIFFN